jgi:hypothetical protein
MTTLLEAGVSEEEVGLDRFRAAASEMREAVPWCSATASGSGSSNARPAPDHSHSIVAGGFEVTSSTTRLISGTSLTMRDEIVSIRS